MSDLVSTLIKKRIQNPQRPGIKVNLYHDYEFDALAEVLKGQRYQVESVMVGDSYYMTHLNQTSTKLTHDQKAQSIDLLPELVNEVSRAMDNYQSLFAMPFLMADVPDGLSATQVDVILTGFKQAGATCVKFEPTGPEHCSALIAAIKKQGLLPAVHMGYKPQINANQLYCSDKGSLEKYKEELIALKQAGAAVVIFERISEVANKVLTQFSIELGLLPYSIFSGKAYLGGQSLNIWDSVVKQETHSVFFPPTACLQRSDVEASYKKPCIQKCIRDLLCLTINQVFPPSPRNNIPVENLISIFD